MQEPESKYGHVRKSWQKTFKILDDLNAADKPSGLAVLSSPEFKALSLIERFKTGWRLQNKTALIFGPFYYLFKGMWLKSAILFSTMFLLHTMSIFVLTDPSPAPGLILILGFSEFGLYALCHVLASHDYYLLKTQNEKTWKSLPNWLNHPAGAIATLIVSMALFLSVLIPLLSVLTSL